MVRRYTNHVKLFDWLRTVTHDFTLYSYFVFFVEVGRTRCTDTNFNMASRVWDEITYPFPNFNGVTVEVCEWISNFIPHSSLREENDRTVRHLIYKNIPDSKVHGTHMGPIWGRQDPGGPTLVSWTFPSEMDKRNESVENSSPQRHNIDRVGRWKLKNNSQNKYIPV